MTDFYLLGYESGQGFGSGLWDHEGLIYDSENWSTQWKNESSKWKEGTNITAQVEELSEEQKLDNGKLFILINKHMFKVCFYNEYSNSRKRNGLVLMMILVDMGTGCILHFIHVAGTSMKRVGIDAFS